MIVPIPRSETTSEENVLPLINVVFLLLIFFMIAGALSATAPFPIEPPTARAPAPTAPPRGGIVIAADGRIAFAGDPVDPATLVECAREWRAGHTGGRALAVRADANAPTGRLLATIAALRKAGIERIRLLAVGRRPGN